MCIKIRKYPLVHTSWLTKEVLSEVFLSSGTFVEKKLPGVLWIKNFENKVVELKFFAMTCEIPCSGYFGTHCITNKKNIVKILSHKILIYNIFQIHFKSFQSYVTQVFIWLCFCEIFVSLTQTLIKIITTAIEYAFRAQIKITVNMSVVNIKITINIHKYMRWPFIYVFCCW